MDEKKIRIVYTSQEVVSKVDPEKKNRFVNGIKKYYDFKTTVHISDITISFSGPIEEISKNDTFEKAYSKLKNLSKLLKRTKNGNALDLFEFDSKLILLFIVFSNY